MYFNVKNVLHTFRQIDLESVHFLNLESDIEVPPLISVNGIPLKICVTCLFILELTKGFDCLLTGY